MALSDLRREMVLAAIAEYDRLGRDAFLERYGYGPARDYFLRHQGRRYDSKAIAGVAHRGVGGRPLRAAEFSGGNATVARALIRLGFEVTAPGTVIDRHSVEDLLQKIGSLRTATSPVTRAPKRHQPLTLLWAIGRAVRGEERLTSWQTTSAELRALIEEFGLDDDRPNPEFPVLRLHHHGLWDLPGHTGAPPASGQAAQQWMRTHRPDSGLQSWVHDLVTAQEDIRAQLVVRLLTAYFHGVDLNTLLARVGLAPDGSATEPPADDSVLTPRGGSPTPGRREVITNRVARDSLLAEQIKRAHDHHCQICGTRLVLRQGFYAEGAHIRPLGRPHDGPDEPDNLLCLCPNHHVLFDRGMITVQDDLTVVDMVSGSRLGTLRLAPNHEISLEHLTYHRRNIGPDHGTEDRTAPSAL
ncbi:HNH endonuclease [Planomonospora sp. ID91781]|uniref:HNH endonuclease n=1 Tax=Planomonospora sp. ID91781 TaxID=2738135 RepID=UPI0018C427C2|nr:HNH endonuclease [Planomonospora sp. ID91781]MBG0822481.1 HNH endonuclease [Planomonospora sp. ID91781]